MANFSANPDGSKRREIDFRAYEPKIDDLRRRIDSVVPYFCPNPCCIQAFCPQHGWCPSSSRLLVDHYCLTMIQKTNYLKSRIPYPESRVMITQKGLPAEAHAFGKSTPHFK